MKLNGNTPFITDNDILLTDSRNAGKSLSTVLTNHTEDINKLKSNVKWIYQNGGVGGSGYGGSGGGSGSSGGGSWSIFAQLNGLEIKSGNTIVLDKPGTYNLMLAINRPNGMSFTARIEYKVGGVTTSKRPTLTLENTWEYSTSLFLNENESISITVTDQNGERKAVNARYVTTPFKCSLSLVERNGTPYVLTDNDVMISDAMSKGLNVKLNYDIAVVGDYRFRAYDIYGNSYNKHTNESGVTVEGDVLKQYDDAGKPLNSLMFNLSFNDNFVINNQCAGLYTFIVILDIKPNGQNTITEEYKVTFNLIPDTLYLKIMPEGLRGQVYLDHGLSDNTIKYEDIIKHIENNTLPENIDNELKSIYETRKTFNEGIISFLIQGYYGPNGNRTFNIEAYVDGQKIALNFTTIVERDLKQIAISSGVPSHIPHELKIVLSIGDTVSPLYYYYYVGQNDSSVTWYECESIIDDTTQLPMANAGMLNYYKCAGDAKTTKMFESVYANNQLYIEMTANSSQLVIDGTNKKANIPNSGHDVFVSFGIQYSAINTSGQILAKITAVNNNTNEDIYIYQDKVTLGLGGERLCEIFIPKESDYNPADWSKYHLVTICKNYVATVSNKKQYEFIVYIDGIVDGAYNTYVDTEVYYDKVIFNPGNDNKSNFAINMFEMSFFPHDKDTVNVRTQAVPYLSWMDDVNIVRYFYKYCTLLRANVGYSEEKVQQLESFKNFLNVEEFIEGAGFSTNIAHGMISCSGADVQNIAKQSNIPTLLLHCIDDQVAIKQGNDFYHWFTKSYNETELSKAPGRKVTVQYSQGSGEELTEINPGTNCSFEIELQGSSTGLFRSKNLDLGITSTQEDTTTVQVFTPNFKYPNATDSNAEKAACYKTFLPEQKFTLKADVVDSSHSNNTTMGEFINDNSTKFETEQKNSNYAPYVKNCLLGFPVQVFITVESKLEDGSTDMQTYYLGIYNFNLGRDSWYNLGYINLAEFLPNDTLNKNGFNVYTLPKPQTHDGLIVAEISGGDKHFDFSQYDETILFDLASNGSFEDKSAMFGDIVTNTGKLEDKHKAIIKNFVKHIALSGGYVFSHTGKNFGSIEGVYHSATSEDPRDSINQVPDWRVQYARKYENGNIYTAFENNKDREGFDLKVNNSINYLQRTLKEIEADKTHPMLDYYSLVEYYTICMVMGLVDSVQKNLNIKTWTSNRTVEGSTTADPTFFIAFYDMDTCLGIDNSGADVSYFAFSDYWKSLYKEENGELVPLPIKTFRDFFPNKTDCSTAGIQLPIGYDIPSSYLFAIAKYAKIFDAKDDYGEYVLNLGDEARSFPGNLYANWRRSTGVLANSKLFVEQYFAKQLDKVSECAMNFNYRMKYLVKESGLGTKFSEYNITPFKGRRVHRLTDWMNGRLHILDGYFNLNNIETNIETYNIETGAWEVYKENNNAIYEAKINSTLIDNSNKDITVLNDIFTSPTASEIGQKYNSTIEAMVQSAEYSPVVVFTAQKANKYLLEDSSKQYKIKMDIEGSIATTFGGSSQWLSISDISSFIPAANTFTLYSDRLNVLYGSSGTCKSWSLGLPAVKTIELTSPNYSGQLNIVGAANFPNINEINISNTKIELNVNEVGVTKIKANNVNSPKLTISNCASLSELNWSNSSFDVVTINPLWTNAFTLNSSISVRELNLVGKPDTPFTVKISNISKLEKLTISGNCTSLIVENCNNLHNVTISVTNTDTKEQETLKILKITNCNASNIYGFKLNADIDGKEINSLVNLKSFTAIETINFSGTKGIICAKMPNKTFKLTSYVFNDTGLKYLITEDNSEIEICNGDSVSTFSSLRAFRPIMCDIIVDNILNDPDNVFVAKDANNPTAPFVNSNYINIKIADNVTSLASVFNYTAVNSNDALWFLDLCKRTLTKEQLRNIKSINSLFAWANLTYTAKEFAQDYKNQTFKFDLSIFNYVINAGSVFYGSGIPITHKYMFKGVGSAMLEDTDTSGSPVGTIKHDKYYDVVNVAGFTSASQLTIDAFDLIITFIETLPYISDYSLPVSDYVYNLTVIDTSSDSLNTMINENKWITYKGIVPLKRLFNGGDESGATYPCMLVSLNTFNFTNDVDYTDLFVESHTDHYKLKYIVYSFGARTITSEQPTMTNPAVNGSNANFSKIGIKYVKTLEFIYSSFNIDNENDVIDLYNFFHPTAWKNIFAAQGKNKDVWKNFDRSMKFGEDATNGSRNGCFNFYKVISKENMEKLFAEYVIPNAASITSLNNLFKYAYVVCDTVADNELNLRFQYSGVANELYYGTDNNGSYATLPNITSVSKLFQYMKFVNSKEDINKLNKISQFDKIIPICLSQNSTKLLRNAKQFWSTFAGLTVSENLPFDFFNKRKRVEQDIYVRDIDTSTSYNYYTLKEWVENGNLVSSWVEEKETYFMSTEYPAKLIKYEYSNDITDMSSCFASMRIVNNTNTYSFNLDSVVSYDKTQNAYSYNVPVDNIQIDTSLYPEISDRTFTAYTSKSFAYNDKTLSKNISYVTLNTEVEDCMNITGLHNNSFKLDWMNGSSKETLQSDISNWFVTDTKDINSLLLPPDIFYPVARNVQVRVGAAFSHANCIGTLPRHITKYINNTSLKQTFYNNFVIPQLLDIVTDDVSTTKVYVYVPKGFTNYSDLNETFNFKLNIPQGNPMNATAGYRQEYNAVYIFEETSIGEGVQNMKNSLPSYVNSMFRTPTYRLYNLHDYGIRFNIMCKIQINNQGVKELVSGINLSTRFTQLNLSNLINNALANILYGQIFDKDFTVNSNINVDISAPIITVSGISGSTHWASLGNKIILPRANQNKSNIINIESANEIVLSRTNNIIGGANSAKYYTNDSLMGSGYITWKD